VLEPSLPDATEPTASRTLRVMDEHVEEFAASFEAFLAVDSAGGMSWAIGGTAHGVIVVRRC